MITLIDTSLWIDFSRPRSPVRLRQFIAPYILHPSAHLAEPIIFELLRFARPTAATWLQRQFATIPTLPTPTDLWSRATSLGRACCLEGFPAAPMDLLIAAVAQAHGATIVSFDRDFEIIGACGKLPVKLLGRPEAE